MPQDWQAESDHSTLGRAEEIKSDSKRMAGVKRFHKKTQRALGKLGKTIGGKR